MSTIVPGGPQESTGEELSPTLREAAQIELFAPIDLDIRTFLRRALRNHLKEAAALAFPHANVERALIDLCRVLDRKSARHLEAEWLRAWARKWTWFRSALGHYWAGDTGGVWIPKKDPRQELERLDSVQDGVTKLARNVEILAREIADLQKARKESDS